MSRKTDAVVARTIGIDTGKNTLHLIGLDDKGAIVLREKLTRGRIAARLANVPKCLIGIEAGMATHRVARELGPKWRFKHAGGAVTASGTQSRLETVSRRLQPSLFNKPNGDWLRASKS